MAGMEAISGTARSGATRSGAFRRERVFVSIAGAVRSGIEKDSISIVQQLGGEPDAASFNIKGGSGFVPRIGQTVVVAHGTSSNRMFAGRVLKATRRQARHLETRPTYEIDAIAYHDDLAVAKMSAIAGQSISAASIARSVPPALVSAGFTAAFVQPDLPVVSDFHVADGELYSSVLDRLAERVGATWRVDEYQRLHFYQSISPQQFVTLPTITGQTTGIWDLEHDLELSSVVSDVVGLGASVETIADVYEDDKWVPLDSAAKGLIFGNTISSTIWGPISGLTIFDGRASALLFEEPAYNYRFRLSANAPVSLTPDGHWVSQFIQESTAYHSSSLHIPWLYNQHWWIIENATFRINSLVVSGGTAAFSSSAGGSISVNSGFFFVPSSGPGSPNRPLQSGIPAGTLITHVPVEAQVNPLIDGDVPDGPRVIPAGTRFSAFVMRENSLTAAAVASITGTSTYRRAEHLGQTGLPGAELLALADQMLADGTVANAETLQFSTRDDRYMLGQIVAASIGGGGEASAVTIGNTFRISRVETGDFGTVAPTKGPVRRITMTPTRRTPPSLWTLLRAKSDT